MDWWKEGETMRSEGARYYFDESEIFWRWGLKRMLAKGLIY
jgi:hypothetical protein